MSHFAFYPFSSGHFSLSLSLFYRGKEKTLTERFQVKILCVICASVISLSVDFTLEFFSDNDF